MGFTSKCESYRVLRELGMKYKEEYAKGKQDCNADALLGLVYVPLEKQQRAKKARTWAGLIYRGAVCKRCSKLLDNSPWVCLTDNAW